jgi:hypothetical protein
MMLFNSLGAVATAVNGKFEVSCPNGHVEPAEIYVMIVAVSGDRKSASVKIAKSPIHRWLARKRVENQEKDRESGVTDSPDLHDIYFEDLTDAGLRRALSISGGRAVHHEPEAGLLRELVRKNSLIRTLCKAYDRESLVIHRGNGPRIEIPNPSASITIAAQPDVALEFARNADVRDSGLLNRFIVVLCPSLAGYRDVDVPPIPQEALDYFDNLVARLCEISVPPAGRSRHKLLMDPAAEQSYFEFARQTEAEIRPGGALSFSAGWASKVVGRMWRIASILHCIYHDDPLQSPIGESTIREAISMSFILAHHGRNFFHCVDYGVTMEIGHKIELWARSFENQGFSAQEARSALTEYSLTSIHSAIKYLQDIGRLYEDYSSFHSAGTVCRRGRPRAARYRFADIIGILPK